MSRVLILGGAGFIGSHLSEAHLRDGDTVHVVDNFCTGYFSNIEPLIHRPGFSFTEGDLLDPQLRLPNEVDFIYHMASPASPPRYMKLSQETMDVNTLGTRRLIDLAEATGARILFASTSEIYGDPLVHPQKEDYWGNVNTLGPRSIYDEAKRFGETMMSHARRERGVNTVLVRIFNTYGPQMDPEDGRVVSSFIRQALQGEKISMFGDGSQTRSFCYVSDLVRGLMLAMKSTIAGPVNLGNPSEIDLKQLAEEVSTATGKALQFEYFDLPEDDPKQRQPDISKAKTELGWEPVVSREEGLALTANWMQEKLS